jgi:aspartate--ammonia ligase
MQAVRKDYFLDHDHSAYVDQWDWERVIIAEQRNLDFLKTIVSKIWKVIVGAEKFAQSLFPRLKDFRNPDLPENIEFCHAEDILEMYPDLPRKQRETRILRQHPAIFIIGIGWPLKMGIRLTKETLRKQLEISKQLDFLKLPNHQAILNDQIPLSIGGTIGQSRTLMLLLRKRT